jgi:hypothetical protein
MRQRGHGWWCWLGLLWTLTSLTMPSAGAAPGGGAAVRTATALPTGQVDWTAGLLESSGQADVIGPTVVPSQASGVYAQAVHRARQRLYQALLALRFDATYTVAQAPQVSASRRLALQELVHTAPVIRTRYTARGSVESTVQLSLFGPLTTALWPTPLSPAPVAIPTSEAVYSGIVLDARGLAIQTALFPRIVDEDAQVLYAPELVDATIAARRGYVVYSTGAPETQTSARVGTHPLVVRARRVTGRSRVDIVMLRTDAARIRADRSTRHLLRQCRVLIVK